MSNVLLELVERDIVSGWDDPRMPTLAGAGAACRQRLREFVTEVGVTKVNGVTEWSLFEYHIRKDLNATFHAPWRFCGQSRRSSTTGCDHVHLRGSC